MVIVWFVFELPDERGLHDIYFASEVFECKMIFFFLII